MNKFIAKFSEQIEGTLSGFDRLVFRGSLRAIAYELGMKTYLWHSQTVHGKLGPVELLPAERNQPDRTDAKPDPKREIRKGRWSGAACGAVLPTCTVVRKSPSKRWTAIGTP